MISIQCGSRGSRYPPRRSTMAKKSPPCRHHQRTIRRCTAKVSSDHHYRRGLNRRQQQAQSLNYSKVTLLPGRVSSGPDQRTTRLLCRPHRRLCPQLRIRRPGLWSPSMGTSMQWSALYITLRSKWRRLELGDDWPRSFLRGSLTMARMSCVRWESRRSHAPWAGIPRGDARRHPLGLPRNEAVDTATVRAWRRRRPRSRGDSMSMLRAHGPFLGIDRRRRVRRPPPLAHTLAREPTTLRVASSWARKN